MIVYNKQTIIVLFFEKKYNSTIFISQKKYNAIMHLVIMKLLVVHTRN